MRDWLLVAAVVISFCAFLWAEAATVRPDAVDPSEASLEAAGGSIVREHPGRPGAGFFGGVADDGNVFARDQPDAVTMAPCADARTCTFSVFERDDNER